MAKVIEIPRLKKRVWYAYMTRDTNGRILVQENGQYKFRPGVAVTFRPFLFAGTPKQARERARYLWGSTTWTVRDVVPKEGG